MQNQKPNEKKTKTILAVFAHPDDEAFTSAGTLAIYARKNFNVTLCCATLGQAGTRRHIKNDQDLGQVRQKELRNCCKFLKIKKLYLLGHIDGKLNKVNKQKLTQQISQIVKENNPDIVITFAPDGITGHVDHVTVSKVTTLAFRRVLASSNSRLFYVTPITREDLNVETGLSKNLSATGQKYISLKKPEDVDVLINIKSVYHLKLWAMRCHFSQDDVRSFYHQLKKRPMYHEAFCLSAGPKLTSKPAFDLFQNL